MGLIVIFYRLLRLYRRDFEWYGLLLMAPALFVTGIVCLLGAIGELVFIDIPFMLYCWFSGTKNWRYLLDFWIEGD